MDKKLDKIKPSIEEYADYFKEVSDVFDECLTKTRKMAENTEKKIEDLSSFSVTTKGTQMQLAEHTANEIGLLNQMQSLAESKFKLKKQILDLAIKENSGEDEDTQNLASAISELVKAQKEEAAKHEQVVEKMLTDAEIDDEIDRILREEN